MLAATLFSLSLLPITLGRPSTDHGKMVVRSQRYDPPSGFSPRSDPVASDELLELILVMSQNNLTGLHTALLDVSDPSSKNYGRHLSKAEVAQHVAPTEESVTTVESWLTSYGITPVARSASGDTLRLRVRVEQANDLLNADYSAYVHHKSNATILRTLSYSLPDRLHEHITLIHPTTQFTPGISAEAVTENIKQVANITVFANTDCISTITPQCLQKLYNIPTTPASAANNSLYITGFGGAVSNQDDLKAFLNKFRPDIEHKGLEVLSLHDASNDGPGTAEGNFDVQYTLGLATHVPVTFINIGNESSGIIRKDLLDLVTHLLDQDTVPLVVTTSYVFNELPNDDEFVAFAHTLCNAFAQLGARGSSVLFASGDGGVKGAFSGDTSAKCDNDSFVATFPSNCPFVTSVGATHGINPEVGATLTSGGFSSVFPRPDYQKDAVEHYLQQLGDKYAGRFNASGRAFPDVSAQGINYLFELGGKNSLFYGTSASSPTVASIVALLNDKLLNAGKSPLGFLNPLLYSRGVSALNDVVSGNNPGCGTEGFPAAEGWDPVTGLGTPDFDRLLSVITGTNIKSNAKKSGAGELRPPNLLRTLAITWLSLLCASLVV